ncbi:hypothetical protein [Phenylobacterium sp.]|jgi:ABC-type transporter Mla subunit MlaD|uniref:hypothetical protein n=1 Tax=Phenylobacterium sp. TaxID=1871053 RepID=UPI002F953E5D
MSDPARESDVETKARRGRNIALALGLALFVVLIFVVTLVRLGANVTARPL